MFVDHAARRGSQVAIDGPVASGKSTVARLLAERLGWKFFDTGALYRAVAYLALEAGENPSDERAVTELLSRTMPQVTADRRNGLHYSVSLAGRTLIRELFTPQVSQAVSAVAAMPQVRQRLIGTQRAFAQDHDVVMAGRDIGSVVLPDAAFKFFLTATLEARVDRRLRQLLSQGVDIQRGALRHEIERRDERDATRSASPLVRAPDAQEIDTSQLAVSQVVAKLSAIVLASSL